jgi:O-phospho-L-seryl-tRNASec:L-selenocysteinyl-tRNA synthase
MALDAIRASGIKKTKDCFVAPLATGMALTLCLSAWSSLRPEARYVIWPRIDQKTCFKCILAAGLTPLIVENVLENDQLVTNLDAVNTAIEEKGSDKILAILSTSSCFAPRVPDKYGSDSTEAARPIKTEADFALHHFITQYRRAIPNLQR